MTAGVGALDVESGLMFETVVFEGKYVQVSYTQAHERGDGIGLIRTFAFDAEKVPEEYHDLLVALRNMVNACSDVLRNPPDTITS